MEFILDFFQSQTSPIMQALYAGIFTWVMTAIGAGLVFLFKNSNRKALDMALGFTGGVMIAASFWSLLSPAIATVEKQQELGITSLPIWFAPAVGFLLGALFLYYLDKKIPHLHLFESVERGARDGLDFSSVDTNWALFDSAFPLTSSQKKRTKQIKKITQILPLILFRLQQNIGIYATFISWSSTSYAKRLLQSSLS